MPSYPADESAFQDDSPLSRMVKQDLSLAESVSTLSPKAKPNCISLLDLSRREPGFRQYVMWLSMQQLTLQHVHQYWLMCQPFRESFRLDEPRNMVPQLSVTRLIDNTGNIIERTSNNMQTDTGFGLIVLRDKVSVALHVDGELLASLSFDHEFSEIERYDPEDLIV